MARAGRPAEPCVVCNTAAAPYRCPRCRAVTCSVNCSKTHASTPHDDPPTQPPPQTQPPTVSAPDRGDTLLSTDTLHSLAANTDIRALCRDPTFRAMLRELDVASLTGTELRSTLLNLLNTNRDFVRFADAALRSVQPVDDAAANQRNPDSLNAAQLETLRKRLLEEASRSP